MSFDTNRLTSAEVSHLWNSYIFDSMVHQLLSYFLNNIEDPEIKEFLSYCHSATLRQVKEYTEILENDNFPIPRGSKVEDIIIDTPRLFTDKFYILYTEEMAKFALTNFTLAYAESTRSDVRKLFKTHSEELIKVHQAAFDILAAKNIYTFPPQIDPDHKIHFVESKHFFAGVLGEVRSLSCFEIKQLYINILNNNIGKTLMMGFAQISKSKDAKEYFLKGEEISNKFIESFSVKLIEENITPPPSLESEVLPYEGTQLPISERLMLNHTVFLNAFGIGNYGLSLAQSQRRDLSALYAKCIVEVGLYADKGADLLVERKWLEQPPLTLGKRHS